MTNREAYMDDLDSLQKTIDYLMSMIPSGKTKAEIMEREKAENAAGAARATIGCMRRDYIIAEL